MNKTLICLIGKSGSGKTTVASLLEEYNLTQIQSYCTRMPRYEGEKGHIFIAEEEYEKYKEDMVAYTYIYNTHYFATGTQVDECDIYVVDYIGFLDLKERYKGNKTIIGVYLDVSLLTRIYRLFKRGDSIKQVCKRIVNDRKVFKGAKDGCDVIFTNWNLDATVNRIVKFRKSSHMDQIIASQQFFKEVDIFKGVDINDIEF